jgi:predicted outer membrane protein
MDVSRHIATCLLLANQEEVALAEYAKEHLKSDDAKKFADMLIKDHKEAASKLQRLVPQQMTVFFRGAGTDEQGQRRAGQQNEASQQGQRGQQNEGQYAQQGARGQQGAQAGLDPMTALEQKTAEECYELTRKELSEHEGSDFDQCFVGSQIGAHISTLAKLRASEQFASPELQPIIKECQQAVEQHLDKAKDLAKEWKQQERK